MKTCGTRPSKASPQPGPEQARLLKAAREFDAYVRANAGRIPDYRERQRAGQAISTALTKSATSTAGTRASA